MKLQFLIPPTIAVATMVLVGAVASAQQGPPATTADQKTVDGGEAVRSNGNPVRDIVSRFRRHGDDELASGDSDDRRSATPPPLPQQPQSEAPFLRDLADRLSVPIPEDGTPGDISFAIRQALSQTTRYSGDVLSDEAFEECRAVIPTTKDTKIFEAYHAFIKKIARKKIFIVKTGE